MIKNLIFNIMLVITFDIYIFFFGQKKYRGHMTLDHYFMSLKMPIYRKVLLAKIGIISFLTILFNILF